MITDPCQLRLEIALINDIGLPLIKFCYKREGDGFLSPTTFDHWTRLIKSVKDMIDINPIYPKVDEVLAGLNNSPNEKYIMKTETLAKAIIVHQKLIFDTDHRLLVTIGVRRACRFWDYRFVTVTPMPALIEEMIHLERLPGCIDITTQLKIQLPTYKTIAEAEIQQPKPKNL